MYTKSSRKSALFNKCIGNILLLLCKSIFSPEQYSNEDVKILQVVSPILKYENLCMSITLSHTDYAFILCQVTNACFRVLLYRINPLSWLYIHIIVLPIMYPATR